MYRPSRSSGGRRNSNVVVARNGGAAGHQERRRRVKSKSDSALIEFWASMDEPVFLTSNQLLHTLPEVHSTASADHAHDHEAFDDNAIVIDEGAGYSRQPPPMPEIHVPMVVRDCGDDDLPAGQEGTNNDDEVEHVEVEHDEAEHVDDVPSFESSIPIRKTHYQRVKQLSSATATTVATSNPTGMESFFSYEDDNISDLGIDDEATPISCDQQRQQILQALQGRLGSTSTGLASTSTAARTSVARVTASGRPKKMKNNNNVVGNMFSSLRRKVASRASS